MATNHEEQNISDIVDDIIARTNKSSLSEIKRDLSSEIVRTACKIESSKLKSAIPGEPLEVGDDGSLSL